MNKSIITYVYVRFVIPVYLNHFLEKEGLL